MKIQEIIDKNLCISCGACQYIAADKITMYENKKKGIFLPKISSKLSDNELKEIEDICPGNGYPIISLSEKIHSQSEHYYYKIGKYAVLKAVKSTSEKILEKASSGGIMIELAIYLIENNYVQGVVATEFDYSTGNIMPKTKIYSSSKDLLQTQGSKYMPVPALTILDEIEKFNGELAYIGTPCQIASLRLLQEKNPVIKKKIKYFIGNFCGGYRDMRELYKLRKIAGMTNESINEFQYRGGGQPGKMIFRSSKKYWEYNYPDYAQLTGYMKYYRCRVCVDATAELADISCGDAWLKKFEDLGGNWSVIIIRNPELIGILNKMKDSGFILEEEITVDELIQSQRQNINSKKERYLSRISFLTKMGYRIPHFDGGWNDSKKTSFLFEAKVFYMQKIMYLLELCNLYRITNKIARKLLKNKI